MQQLLIQSECFLGCTIHKHLLHRWKNECMAHGSIIDIPMHMSTHFPTFFPAMNLSMMLLGKCSTMGRANGLLDSFCASTLAPSRESRILS